MYAQASYLQHVPASQTADLLRRGFHIDVELERQLDLRVGRRARPDEDGGLPPMSFYRDWPADPQNGLPEDQVDSEPSPLDLLADDEEEDVDSEDWRAELDAELRLLVEGEYPARSPYHAPWWEVDAPHAQAWRELLLKAFLGHPKILWALESCDFALLLSDLHLWHERWWRWKEGRGPRPDGLDTYLRPGREHWGLTAQIARRVEEELGASITAELEAAFDAAA